MQIDRYGNILCIHCGKPFPPSRIGLAGLCRPCKEAYTRRCAAQVEAKAVLSLIPSMRGR